MIIPSGYGLITHFFSGAAVPDGAAVTYGVRNLADFSATEMAEAARDEWDASNFDSLASTDCDMFMTRAKLGPNATGPFADVTSNTGGAGNTAGAAQVCILMKKQTDSGGRRNRGRMFLPGIPEDQIGQGGQITSGTVTVANAAGLALITGLATALIPMVILHDDVDFTPTLVTSFVVSPYVATQRNRQPRGV